MFPPPWTSARDGIEEEPTNLLTRSRQLQVMDGVCGVALDGLDAARLELATKTQPNNPQPTHSS